MNLVQLQERLKEMPMRAIEAYANGSNPEVPPYLALGEMERRSRMMQMAQTPQPPQGTVKEKLESQLGQAQMPQQGGIASAPMGPVQPEEAGVGALPVPTQMMQFNSGGIVAFNGEEESLVPMSQAERQMEEKGSIYSKYYGLPKEERERLEAADRRERGSLLDQLYKLLPSMGATRQVGRFLGVDKALEKREEKRQAEAEAESPVSAGIAAAYGDVSRRKDIPTAAAAPVSAPRVQQPSGVIRPAVAPPSGIETAIGLGPLQQQLVAALAAKPVAYPSRETLLAQQTDPYLKKRPGEVAEEYLTKAEREMEEERGKFQQSEKERAREALWKSLLAAGEGSRGGQGIGGLLSGFGRTALESMESSRQREAAQRATERDMRMNFMKMRQSIEDSRIAMARGDFNDALKAQTDAATFAQRANADRNSLLASAAGAEQRTEVAKAQMAQEERLRKADMMLRERLHQPNIENVVFNAYLKSGLTADQAYQRMVNIKQEPKTTLTLNQATDNVDNLLKNRPQIISEEIKRAKAEGRPVPTSQQIRDELIMKEMARAQGGMGQMPADIQALLNKYGR